MDSPILSLDHLWSGEECDAPIPLTDVPLDAQMDERNSRSLAVAHGLSDVESMSMSPTLSSPNSEMYGGSISLSVASPSSRRNSINDLSIPPSPSAFSFSVDQDFIDFVWGTTGDAIAPSCDESLPSVSENCPPDSRQKVPVKRSRAKRQSAWSSKKIGGDSSSSPVACVNEGESVAMASSTSGATASAASSNGLPSVKIVKVVKSSGSGNSAEDVLKALDDKNRRDALLARSNRAKKKAYIQGLEKDVQTLTEEKTGLQKAMEEKNERIGELEGEVEYLRSVLFNDSALAGLLKTMNRGCELRGSGAGSRKRGSDGDHDYTSPHKRPRRPATSGGVCLHVDQDSVSLQLCSMCAQKPAEGN